MEINKKILWVIMVLYDIDNDTSNKIENTLEKLPNDLKENIFLSLVEALYSHKKNIDTLSIKTNLISNSIDELREKQELQNFKI